MEWDYIWQNRWLHRSSQTWR